MTETSIKNPFDHDDVRRLVRDALVEDRVSEDVTVSSLRIGGEPLRALIVSGSGGVICGLPILPLVYAEIDSDVDVEILAADGDRVSGDEDVARINGPANAILAGERVALNFVGHLSGIATLTARYVNVVGTRSTTILDTRKTTPLMRDLEKYAARMGGACNHRRDLSSMVLVKENHVRALGGTTQLIARLNDIPAGLFIEVEVDSIDLLRAVLDARADRVMLDNFTPSQVEEAVGIVRSARARGRQIEVEVSGGVELDTISGYAIDGVDFISIGALTHSAPALPVSMEVERS